MEPLRKPRAAPRENDSRTNQLARIHILRKDCELGEDDYRALILSLTNGRTTSTASCDHTERERIIEHFTKLKRALGKDTALPQWKKLRALWAALYAKSLVSANTEGAMNTWAQRQLGEGAKASARWCNNAELERLIEAAKAWLARANRPK